VARVTSATRFFADEHLVALPSFAPAACRCGPGRVRAPGGSMSTRSTRFSATAAKRTGLTGGRLPTPPFWFATTMTPIVL